MNSLKTRFVSIFGAFVVLAVVLFIMLTSKAIKNTCIKFAESQGRPIVEKASQVVNGNSFEALVSKRDGNAPYYEQLRKALLEIKKTTGCSYLYTMAIDENGVYRYIVDGSCPPIDKEHFSPFWSEEDISGWGKAPLIAFETGKMAVSGLVDQDDWGWAISTYTGIKNHDGKIVGIIGCDVDISELVQAMNSEIRLIVMLGVVIVIIGFIFVYLIFTRLFKKVEKISSEMATISEGKADLTSRIKETGGKELVKLAQDCNKVISSMDALVSNLQKQSGVLSDTGNQLYDKMSGHITHITSAGENVQRIAESINLQTDKVEAISTGVGSVENEINGLENRITQQNSAIEECSAAIQQISRNIVRVNEIVENITTEYSKLVEESNTGRNNQEKVSEQIAQIAEQSENLTEANAAIAAIAEQTNLLAMNAAIEAAHAGELGKGFGVVADEIRSLAETSATQSAQIKDLLEGISNAIASIVKSSNVSTDSFENVGNRIVQMNGMLQNVGSGMQEETASVGNILETLKELSAATKGITESSAAMRSESTKLFKGIDELQQMASATQNDSNEVASVMEKMKLEADEAVSASQKNLEASNSVITLIEGFKVNA